MLQPVRQSQFRNYRHLHYNSLDLNYQGAMVDTLLTTISIKMFYSLKLWVGITKG